MAEPKKHHLVKLISTAGWFMETKAPFVVNICGSLKREGWLSSKICVVSYKKLGATEDLDLLEIVLMNCSMG